MLLTCIKSGTLATVQDLGRIGYQNLGIIVSGAMDSYALQIGNIILGNKRSEAAIEITMRGTSFHFSEDTLIAITGGDLNPSIDNKKVPQWRPVVVRANKILKFKGSPSGLRSYLSVCGGFNIDEVLGSKSTYLRASFGGYEGRALKNNDTIALNPMNTNKKDLKNQLLIKNTSFKGTKWHVRLRDYSINEREKIIRFVEGNEYEWFSDETKKNFEKTPFIIDVASDRMGYRLSGQKLERHNNKELISEAIVNGTVQVSNDGSPIVLLADRQTTGGYPRIAQVISADLHKFAQLKSGEKIIFKKVTLLEAYRAFSELEKALNQIELASNL
ncbi:MAG: biotin-dependent carboxyltransferase family protein [Kurthia sp.]|nr:biotin-dependent carboxyltransferase family protein [Candidatus Kurthia equi]